MQLNTDSAAMVVSCPSSHTRSWVSPTLPSVPGDLGFSSPFFFLLFSLPPYSPDGVSGLRVMAVLLPCPPQCRYSRCVPAMPRWFLPHPVLSFPLLIFVNFSPPSFFQRTKEQEYYREFLGLLRLPYYPLHILFLHCFFGVESDG